MPTLRILIDAGAGIILDDWLIGSELHSPCWGYDQDLWADVRQQHAAPCSQLRSPETVDVREYKVVHCILQVIEIEVEGIKINSTSFCWKGEVAVKNATLFRWLVGHRQVSRVTSSPNFILWRYSVGYFYQPDMTLDEAQLAKMEMIGRKLDLKPGILDKSLKEGGEHVWILKDPLELFADLPKMLRFGYRCV